MKTKIIVATHKQYSMPEGEEFVPVLVGAALPGRSGIAPYRRDDEGENISAKNANWCELTGLYWAWKNGWGGKV